MLRGQYVIIALVVLGLGAGLLSVWVRHSQAARALQYWGPQHALLIRDAGVTELLTLPTTRHAPTELSRDPAALREMASAREPIRGRAGTSHLWHALLQDESYQWQVASRRQAAPIWTHVLVFERSTAEEAASLIVLIDLERGWLRGPGHRPALSIAPLLAFSRRVLLNEPPAGRPRGAPRGD